MTRRIIAGEGKWARPLRLLDLYCGAGGAALGYAHAGFDYIVGVDNQPQPNYRFPFIQADALDILRETSFLQRFDLVHASPPCQIHSTLKATQDDDYHDRHEDLVAITRGLLQDADVPYVIENVPGAPLNNPITLCGSMFDLRYDGYELRRHRLFELSWDYPFWPPCQHRDPVLGVYGDLSKNPRPSNRGVKAGIEQAEALMGINWMTPKELVQAIPPAYTEDIGWRFREWVHARATLEGIDA